MANVDPENLHSLPQSDSRKRVTLKEQYLPHGQLPERGGGAGETVERK